MSNLKSNKVLGGVLLVLALLVLYIYLGGGGRKERTLKNNLVTVDTARVSEIVITPKSKNENVKLFKKSGKWRVELAEGKSAIVAKDKIDNLLRTIIGIKPNRLVSRKKSNWDKYEVGEKSTRVEVFENGSKNLDIIIGKFSYEQPRSMNSYVRLTDEDEVYEVNGFLSMTFNKDKNQFRNNTIIKDSERNWESLTFKYPEDSFSLVKDNGVWKLDGVKTDSAKTIKYLRSLERLSSTDYLDDFKNGKITKTLTIERNDSTTLIINEMIADSLHAITSSVNSGNYFNAEKGNLGKKIFVDKSKFFK